MPQNIKIITYGAGNIASVKHAFRRLGQSLEEVSGPSGLLQADKLIFPGVGHARPAMAFLKEKGLDASIVAYDKPVLGICLGMQLMAGGSEEGNTMGLGIFTENVKRFLPGVKVPHMGWNQVETDGTGLFNNISSGAHFYFVHSYYMETGVHTAATCRYQRSFTAAAARDNFHGVQFHPEKSGEAGMQVLKNFISL